MFMSYQGSHYPGSQKKNVRLLQNNSSTFIGSGLHSHICEYQGNEFPSQLRALVEVYVRQSLFQITIEILCFLRV